MYNMKRFSAAQARQHLADVLDAAEAGEPVVIERGGVRFTVRAESKPQPRRRVSSVEWMDPVVESGNWTWVSTKAGLTFSPRRPRRR
jgi:antitoxin (DNA-binding transcriptional repressor) of toxin-antitoxin stability system